MKKKETKKKGGKVKNKPMMGAYTRADGKVILSPLLESPEAFVEWAKQQRELEKIDKLLRGKK